MDRLTVIALGIGLLCLGGCGSGDDAEGEESSGERIPPASEGVVTHPVEERIPYHDREAIPITKDQTIEALPDSPESLQVLASWLQDPPAIDTTQLGFFVDSPGVFGSFGVASIGADRVILFDGQHRLFEHNLQTGKTTQIARQGDGPGELKGAYDLMRDASSVYVSRPGRRVEHFTCDPTPCEHSETIRLPVEPFAVAGRDQGLAALGLSVEVIQGGESKEFGENIHLIDPGGTVDRSFGAVYLTTRPMVWQKYIRYNSLVYANNQNRYIHTSGYLPYIWTYNKDGNIHNIFRINNYSLAKFEYDSKDRSMSGSKTDDYHRMRSLSILNSKFIISKVEHPKEDEVDYYAINLEDNEPYFVGTDSYGEDIEDRSFYVTDHHQVLVENGAVAMVQ